MTKPHPLVLNLVALRLARNMSQRELAIASRLDRKTIQRFENSKRPPSLRVLQQYAAGLGLEVVFSFTPKGQNV